MTKIISYKNQETVLLLINMAVLAALFIVHIGFLFEIGRPSKFLLITLATRFIVLIFELLWVQKISDGTSEKAINFHTHLSIWLNIIFAFIASVFGGIPDSHYSVLMIIPIIAAAYRFNLWQTLLVAGIAIVLTFTEVWLYFYRKPPIDYGEFFEAATVSLIFLVVGGVVWLLVTNLRREERKLAESLAELKQMQARLVAEEKMGAVGQLSSAVAHEIRNPVAMIASSLAMAEKDNTNSTLRREMLEIAARESKRLEDLTTDFLAFARTKEPELRQTKICDILEYTADLARAKAAEKNLEIEVGCDTNLIWKVDASQIQQALLNLLVNALDATEKNGEAVFLSARLQDDKLILAVENSGDTIDEKFVESIFEPFFTAKPKGTGLGLSIVHKIAKAHGGEAILAENANGKVRFEIRIPDK